MVVQLTSPKRKILKMRTKEEMLMAIRENAKNGWELISDIKCDYSHSTIIPWIAVMRNKNTYTK